MRRISWLLPARPPSISSQTSGGTAWSSSLRTSAASGWPGATSSTRSSACDASTPCPSSHAANAARRRTGDQVVGATRITCRQSSKCSSAPSRCHRSSSSVARPRSRPAPAASERRVGRDSRRRGPRVEHDAAQLVAVAEPAVGELGQDRLEQPRATARRPPRRRRLEHGAQRLAALGPRQSVRRPPRPRCRATSGVVADACRRAARLVGRCRSTSGCPSARSASATWIRGRASGAAAAAAPRARPRRASSLYATTITSRNAVRVDHASEVVDLLGDLARLVARSSRITGPNRLRGPSSATITRLSAGMKPSTYGIIATMSPGLRELRDGCGWCRCHAR